MSTDVINERVTSVSYPIHEAKIAEWADQYLPLTIDDINDAKALSVVHEARMTVKNARVEIEKRRKALKEDSLRYGREVDSVAKYLTGKLQPIEDHLAEQENKVTQEKERIRQAKLEEARAKVQSRVDALHEVGCIVPFAECEAMTEECFTARLATETCNHKAAKAAEAERLRVQAAETERLRREAEAMAAERAALEKVKREQEAEAARLAAERKAIEDAEAAKRRAEEMEKAKAEAAEKARIETEKRIELEKAEALAKAAAEEAEAARLAALRPDCDKLNALADAIAAVERPAVSSDARKAMVACEKAIATAVAAIRKAAKSLAAGGDDED